MPKKGRLEIMGSKNGMDNTHKTLTCGMFRNVPFFTEITHPIENVPNSESAGFGDHPASPLPATIAGA